MFSILVFQATPPRKGSLKVHFVPGPWDNPEGTENTRNLINILIVSPYETFCFPTFIKTCECVLLQAILSLDLKS